MYKVKTKIGFQSEAVVEGHGAELCLSAAGKPRGHGKEVCAADAGQESAEVC